MPTITLNISAGDLTRAVDALSVRWGYSPFLADGVTPNPQTKSEFVRLRIGAWIKAEVREHELAAAKSAVTVTDIGVA